MDKTSEKYQVALKVVNKLLVHIGREEVDDLLDFKMIDREDLLKLGCREVVEEMEAEIYMHFDKTKSGYYDRKKVKSYHLSVIKNFAHELDMTIDSKQISRTTEIGGRHYTRSHYYWSFVKP